jgi:deferrochelatase/peroxidase EfeB
VMGEKKGKKVKIGEEFADKPKGGVGLLFMAYQSSIANQFEVTQQHWANAKDFVKSGVGLDPVIGQGSTPQLKCPFSWDGSPGPDGKTTKDLPFLGAVTMKGGEYFFAPSLSGLKNL